MPVSDAVDRIAYVFGKHCTDSLGHMQCIVDVVNMCETNGDALEILAETHMLPSDKTSHIRAVRDDIPRMTRVLERMQDIK